MLTKTAYIPRLPHLKCHSGICLAAKQPLASLVQLYLERVLLIASQDRIFHDLPHDILKLPSPEIEILITICRSLLHNKALDATILDSFFHLHGHGEAGLQAGLAYHDVLHEILQNRGVSMGYTMINYYGIYYDKLACTRYISSYTAIY